MARFGLLDTNQAESSSDEEISPLPLSPDAPRAPRRIPLRKTGSSSSSVLSPVASTSKAEIPPFTPKPVHLLPRQPRLPTRFGKSRLVAESSDSDSGGDQGGAGKEGEEEEEDETDDDSEEDLWPVGPKGSVGMGGFRRTTKGLVIGHDDLDEYEGQTKANSWATANRSFHISRARALSPPLSSRANSGNNDPSVASLSSLLSGMALAHQKSQATLVAAFEQRNAALWDDIEKSIKVAEQLEGEKQRVMEENRRKGEEAERKAREMREAAEKRAREETEKEAQREEVQRKEAEDEDKRRKEEAKRVADEAKAAAAAAAAAPPPPGSVKVAAPGTAEAGSPQAEWERWNHKMIHIKTAILPTVSSNPAYRSACFAAKRAIKPKIGQLTASAAATSRIINQLNELLNPLKEPGAAPEPYVWVLNNLAKALVKQAEQEVTAKLSTAYPLARVVVGLLLRGHTELGEVLMARLVKKCFWITGWWPPRQPGQSDDDHRKALGHAPISAAESVTQYATRQSGLVALYGAIIATNPLAHPQGPAPQGSLALANVPAHFRPSAGWRVLNLLLLPPLAPLEPTPLLVVTFLEVAGPSLLETYGRQAGKLLECLLREGLRENKAGFNAKARSSEVRLLLWLEEWEKKGVAEELAGRQADLTED